MATFYEKITEKQTKFIREQHIFFVATAHKDGRINLSPKGMDTFRVLDTHTVAFSTTPTVTDLSGQDYKSTS